MNVKWTIFDFFALTEIPLNIMLEVCVISIKFYRYRRLEHTN